MAYIHTIKDIVQIPIIDRVYDGVSNLSYVDKSQETQFVVKLKDLHRIKYVNFDIIYNASID